MAVDNAGNVYVTGSSENHPFGVDFFTVKYAAGNVYVMGSSYGLSTGYDFATVKYNTSGIEQWVARYDGPASSIPGSLAIDNAGYVYVTGISDGQNASYSSYTTIKYDQTPVSVEEQRPNQPGAYWLAQNYPNPFNPATTIRYAIPQPGHVTLKIYNLAGQEMVTLVSEKKPAGKHEVQWNPGSLPSGVYVYRLQAGDPSAGSGQGFSESRKLVLMK